MIKWTIFYSEEANNDILNISRYLTKIACSQSLVNKIIDSIETLDNMPFRNPLYELEPWHSQGLRKFIIDNYIVFYITNEQKQEILIMHIFYAGRNISELL